MARFVGLDLGSTYTRIWTPENGIILRCPTAAAIDKDTKKLVALGAKAREMLGKTPPDILASRPIREGLLSDYEMGSLMLREMFLNKQLCSTFRRPTVLMGIPYRINQSLQLAAENAVFDSGARAVAQIPSIYAAAAGAGLRVASPRGCMVLNIGGGISETAVISSGGIISAHSIRVAGERFDNAIINYLKNKRNLEVGLSTAEELRVRIGACDSGRDGGSMTVYGRNARTGLPMKQEVFSGEICESITPSLSAIARGVTAALEGVPPEIAADVYSFGLMLTGGCAVMPGLPDFITRHTGLRVTVADHPMDCVINGLGRILRKPELWGVPIDYRLK